MADRKSIMLYFDSIEQWKMLSPEQAGALIVALLQYGKTGERLETADKALEMAFSFLAAQIDRDSEKYEQTCARRREAAQKRLAGADTPDTKECKSIQVHTNAQSAEQTEESPKKSRAFVPPTVEEVREYCQERKNNVNPQSFIDFYSSKGWFVGKNKMKDWKAAVRTWEQRSGEKKSTERTSFEQSSFGASDLESLVNQF